MEVDGRENEGWNGAGVPMLEKFLFLVDLPCVRSISLLVPFHPISLSASVYLVNENE